MTGLLKTPKAPEIKQPAPQPNQAEIKKAARRRTATDRRSSGAESTLLSTGGRETLGA